MPVLAGGTPRASASLSLDIDHSMVPSCRKVLAGDPQAIPELLGNPTVQLLSNGMGPEATFTPREFADASREGSEDPRFSWKQFRQRRDQVEQLYSWIQANEEALRRESPREATRFIAALPHSSRITVHLVCGLAADAFGLTIERRPELFLDLGMLAQEDLVRAGASFRAILTHELWHAALALEGSQLGWPNYRDAPDPATRLAFVMLNEGGGHFHSLRPRLEDRSAAAETGARFRSAFALLARNYSAYASAASEDQRRKMLWSSHAGVPFWEKWGAIPGAYVFLRLSQVLGDGEVARLVSSGPYDLLFRYAELQARTTSWPALPAQLLADLHRASRARR